GGMDGEGVGVGGAVDEGVMGRAGGVGPGAGAVDGEGAVGADGAGLGDEGRSEEDTAELQSVSHLVGGGGLALGQVGGVGREDGGVVRADALFPYTTLFRSGGMDGEGVGVGGAVDEGVMGRAGGVGPGAGAVDGEGAVGADGAGLGDEG